VSKLENLFPRYYRDGFVLMKVASAFMIDVQQIALALRACTKRSLVIIDEFGKGTESQGLYSRWILLTLRWGGLVLCGIRIFPESGK
jgi:hypothetical protein